MEILIFIALSAICFVVWFVATKIKGSKHEKVLAPAYYLGVFTIGMAIIFFLSGCAPYFTNVPDKKDHWQTCEYTDEFMKGDCEDYAIWKRCQLIEAGADPEEVQLIIGTLNGVKHMVVRYRGVYYDNHHQQGIGRYPEFVIERVVKRAQLEKRLARDNP